MIRVAAWFYFALETTLFGSLFAAVLGWRTGAFVAIGAFLLMMAIHLGGAAVWYRRTMRRPWPKVQPIEDDDEW